MWLAATILDNITLQQLNYVMLFIRNLSEIIIFFIKDKGIKDVKWLSIKINIKLELSTPEYYHQLNRNFWGMGISAKSYQCLLEKCIILSLVVKFLKFDTAAQK